MNILVEQLRAMLQATQKGYVPLQAQAAELAECCQDLLDCIELRDGNWAIIPRMDINRAIINASAAIIAFKNDTSM